MVSIIVLSGVAGCGRVEPLWPKVLRRATATPSPTHTVTATPTPTASATPTVTTTPSPTATPLPTATATPVRLQIHWLPASVQQGNTLLLQALAPSGSRLGGNFDGQEIHFVESDGTTWALIGVPPWSAVGPRPLTVQASGPDGSWQEATAAIPVTAADFPTQEVTLSPSRSQLLAPAIVQAEAARLQPVWQEFSPRPFWQGRFILPATGRYTSLYGTHRSYNGAPPAGYHGGVDIAAGEGTPVLAAAAAVVALAEPLQVRGNAVILNHGAGMHSAYYHLSRIDVAVGEPVRQGQQIGLVGATGLSTGAHLHWEVRAGEIFVNPLEWTERAMGLGRE